MINQIFFKSYEASLTIFNNTVYTAKYSYGYTSKKDEYIVKGWIKIEPGQELTHVVKTKDKNAKFSILAFTPNSESELLRWVYDINEDIPIVMEFVDSENTESILFNTYEDNFEYKISATNLTNQRHDARLFTQLSLDSERNAEFVLQDPDITSLFYDPSSQNYKSDLKEKLKLAPIIRRSLERQMWFSKAFKNPEEDYPFMLANLDDDNGFHTQGVRVSSLFKAQTINGGDFPLLLGDYIISADEPVFSGSDLYAQLYFHGIDLNKGVEIPLRLSVIRNDQIYTIECPYFFNENYFGFESDSKEKAMGYGFVNSVAYGFSSEAIALSKQIYVGIKNLFNSEKEEIPNFKKNNWEETQKEYRLKQRYLKDYNNASFAGIWVSPAQVLTKSTAKTIAKVGISKNTSRILAAALIETTEGAVYSYNTTPITYTTKQKMKAAMKAVPESLAIGVLIGTLVTS